MAHSSAPWKGRVWPWPCWQSREAVRGMCIHVCVHVCEVCTYVCVHKHRSGMHPCAFLLCCRSNHGPPPHDDLIYLLPPKDPSLPPKTTGFISHCGITSPRRRDAHIMCKPQHVLLLQMLLDPFPPPLGTHQAVGNVFGLKAIVCFSLLEN